MNAARAVSFLLLGALGCDPYSVAPGSVEAPRVEVTPVAEATIDAVLPTDLLVRADGSFLVLDGYGGRVLTFTAAGTASGEWAPGGFGRPVRMSNAADGGVWAAVPGADGVAGLLVHLDAVGTVAALVAPVDADGAPLAPVDVLEQGDGLLVADRGGALAWVDPTTGAVKRTVDKDADGQPLRRVVDLAPGAAGTFVAVDSFATRVVPFHAAGTAGAGFGRPGLNVGQFARPSGAAVHADGDVFVADASLGAVQVFEPDGDLVGVLAQAGAPVSFSHPVAVVSAGSRVAVLEARPARLRVFDLAAALPPAPPRSLLKTALVGADADPAGEGGDSCLQCHDGLVLDSREVWDPARKHHPVGIVPKEKPPEVFKLDAEGKLVCTSCHSPHGVVEAASGEASLLVRHSSSASPFTRLEKEADALCLACHTGDAHVTNGSTALATDNTGHATGSALVAALERRADSADAPGRPTEGSCLSCHAMHGATGDHITRDPGDGAACLGCHPAVAKTATNHPLGRVPGSDLIRNHKDQKVVLSADGGIGCLSCHDLNGKTDNHLVRSLSRGQPVCLDCHAGRKDVIGGGHARLASSGSPTCVACHDLHGGQRDDHFLVTLAAASAGDPKGCLTCHGEGGRAAKRGVTPGKAGHPVDGREAGGAPLTCLSCHDPHEASKPGGKECAACHEEQGAAAARGGHGKAGCADCHAAHQPTLRASRTASGAKVNPASGRCLTCHATNAMGSSAPKVADYEHPAPMFKPDGSRWTPLGGLPLFDKTGEPVGGDANGDLTCQSCHVVHGPDPKGGTKLRRAEGWEVACGSCHGEETLVLYQYFHKPEGRTDLRGGTR